MEELGRPTKQDEIDFWRAGELERAGFDETTAMQLALMPHVDIHRAAELRAAGCPLELVVDILS